MFLVPASFLGSRYTCLPILYPVERLFGKLAKLLIFRLFSHLQIPARLLLVIDILIYPTAWNKKESSLRGKLILSFPSSLCKCPQQAGLGEAEAEAGNSV